MTTPMAASVVPVGLAGLQPPQQPTPHRQTPVAALRPVPAGRVPPVPADGGGRRVPGVRHKKQSGGGLPARVARPQQEGTTQTKRVMPNIRKKIFEII